MRNYFFPAGLAGPRDVEETVYVGSRRFTISYMQGREIFHAHVRPEPAHSGVVEQSGLGALPSETKLKYRITVDPDAPYQLGRFQQIETVPDEQRRGWARDMVRALMSFFPTVYWNNESLNEQSGPLFIKLHAEFPQQIAAVTDNGDGTYHVAENPILRMNKFG